MHTICECFSEKEYEKLEPWIQWVSAVTGLDANSHKVFRLGDVIDANIEQIYERLEKKGYKIGAISPMNVNNKLKEPAFFLPDPWTNTSSDKSFWNENLYKALKQAVNDNADNKIEFKSLIIILLTFLKFYKFKNLKLYLKLFFRSFKRPWCRSLILDLLLHDIHLSLLKQNVDFSSIFFNAGAHIQHHYFYNMVENKKKNPQWYVKDNINPAFDLFEVYDTIIGDYLKLYKNNIIVATGLSQELSEHPFYYYRLKDHESFFRKMNIKFTNIFPRMSRDFLIEFENEADSKQAEHKISNITDNNGLKLFSEVDNRGKSIFVSLTYSDEIKKNTIAIFENKNLNLYDEVSFVALKNGIHSTTGYLFASENIQKMKSNSFHVKNIFNIIDNYFIKKN
mgnify:CR=1 FL=1